MDLRDTSNLGQTAESQTLQIREGEPAGRAAVLPMVFTADASP